MSAIVHTRHWMQIALGAIGVAAMVLPTFASPEDINGAHALQSTLVPIITAIIAAFGGQDVIKGWLLDFKKAAQAPPAAVTKP